MRTLIGTVAVLLLLAPNAFAGTICGTVRDVQTNQPVARALILVRTPAGDYTGLHAGSDSNGDYCVLDVPPGVYDLEVRVENYAVGYVPGVVVDVDQGGVDVSIPAPRLRLFEPSPNPATRSTRLSFALVAPLGVPARLTIHDVGGRFVAGWEAALGAASQSVEWNLRDSAGSRVPPGVYYVRLAAQGERRTTRIVVTE